jgi:hypothetical protein
MIVIANFFIYCSLLFCLWSLFFVCFLPGKAKFVKQAEEQQAVALNDACFTRGRIADGTKFRKLWHSFLFPATSLFLN